MASLGAADMAASVGDGAEIDLVREGNGSARGGKGGRGGRGGRGGKSGGGAGGGQNREVVISKALSKLLRHAAEDEGLKLDGEGFARLDLVMQWPRLRSLKPTFADIRTAVSDNAKQRFSMKPNPALPTPPSPSSENPSDWVIRANQGHSIAIDSAALLVPITLEAGNIPETCVHGTYFAFYEEIVRSGGLKKMGRNHVHFGTGVPEDGGVVSGMRGDAEVLVYVDVQKCLEEEPGMKWWMSENGVVLTEGDAEGLLRRSFGRRWWGGGREGCFGNMG
ncbi:tRNA 2'-phosphotransferase [Ciborinia camelliae]|nr:tRNA 2'-phosphotransferase [Ciborinia camelliae]